VIEKELPDSPGRYELRALLDDSVTEKLDLASKFGGDRLRILIDIDEQGDLSFLINQRNM
jgi:hypothetical protein